MSNSLPPHELQHARLPCPSLSPRICSNYGHGVGDAIQPSQPLSPLLLLPSIFSSELALHIREPKYWSFNFSISPSNEYSGPDFKTDWFQLLAFQGTLKSLLQYPSSKASILWCSAFFMVQLSHLYRTTRKTRDLTIQTFVCKVMSLVFTTSSSFESSLDVK